MKSDCDVFIFLIYILTRSVLRDADLIKSSNIAESSPVLGDKRSFVDLTPSCLYVCTFNAIRLTLSTLYIMDSDWKRLGDINENSHFSPEWAVKRIFIQMAVKQIIIVKVIARGLLIMLCEKNLNLNV